MVRGKLLRNLRFRLFRRGILGGSDNDDPVVSTGLFILVKSVFLPRR
jgi:hypothetical protein